MYSKDQAIQKMNDWANEATPFLFIIDYKGDKNLLYPLDEVPDSISYNINGRNNGIQEIEPNDYSFDYEPVPFLEYQKSFNYVISELNYGNSYLLNLTFPTRLATNLSLATIYHRSRAPYKLFVKDSFVVFSPECFIKIEGNIISSYPMKGTINASIPNARALIINDEKEKAEHATIVDLIRNDLSMVADDVRVAKYRYIDRVKTINGDLLQVSSKIEGRLDNTNPLPIGSIIFTLLPAGSISGAPKRKTLEIIEAAESGERGYFTGIFGIYDGKNLDTGVMIRFIEQKDGTLLFKSGGGITAKSKVEAEYEELINKVYVPFI